METLPRTFKLIFNIIYYKYQLEVISMEGTTSAAPKKGAKKMVHTHLKPGTAAFEKKKKLAVA